MNGVGGGTDSHGGAPADRTRRGVALLRLGVGAAWLANVFYIADPANGFFTSFSGVAASFGSSSAGGPGFAEFVAQYSFGSSLLIAAVTISLAIAFLSDVAVRAACVVGAAFNVALLVTQWGLVATIPGGTDIGPQPLYLIAYGALWVGYRPGDLSLRSATIAWVHRRRATHGLPVRAPDGV
jgi:hypothetical protein